MELIYATSRCASLPFTLAVVTDTGGYFRTLSRWCWFDAMNEWMNRPTVDQGSSVLLVHVSVFDHRSSLLLSPPRGRRMVAGGETCELNVTQWLTARRGGAVIQGHTIVSNLAWPGYKWSSTLVTATKRPSDQGHFPDDFLMVAYDHVRLSPFLADILTSWVLIRGCVLYIGLQIFALWQKSKVGVRIIFDGVLYSKFYGNISETRQDRTKVTIEVE